MRGAVRAVIAALVLTSAVAHAQPVDVPAQIKLIEQQPGDLDRAAWKEKRREAARRLVASKDKRAIPILIKLADTETFDIIGEIAIEGLGNFGDQSAVPVLQRVANDKARDKATRDVAAKALAKLGTTTDGGTEGGGTEGGGTEGGGTEGGGTEGGGTEGGGTEGGGTPLGGGTGNALLGGGGTPNTTGEVPAGPDLPDDTLAAYDRLTFAIGTASLSYDTVRKRKSFDADVGGSYQKRIERESMAWGWDAGAHVVAGYISPEGRAQVRGAQLTADGGGEARFYRGKLYGVGRAAAGFQSDYISARDANDPNQDVGPDNRFHADLQIAIGGGYGRVLDVGGAIRVRRLARALDAARALGKAIEPATAKKLQLAWWALRGDRSTYRALVATVAILREAGVLLSEPDAGLSYELLAVLRDSQLYLRPSGLDVQVAFGEGFLIRPDMDPTPNEEGRVEQLLVSAGYGQQLADDKAELAGTAFARLRLFAPDTQPSPWALGATARLRRFTYGAHGDLLAAIDVAATILLSDDSCVGMGCTSQLAARIQGEVGFTMFMNQASGLRVAGTVAQDGGELFIGGQISATYGLLDGTFAR